MAQILISTLLKKEQNNSRVLRFILTPKLATAFNRVSYTIIAVS